MIIIKTLMHRAFSTRTMIHRGKKNIEMIGGFKEKGKNSMYRICTVLHLFYEILIQLRMKKVPWSLSF